MSRFSQHIETLRKSRRQRRDAQIDAARLKSESVRAARQAATKKSAETKKLAQAEKLERVNTISKNARGLWFGLLAALVFSGITLLQVEDIDFFGVNRATDLPLVGVSVPVMAFFAAGGALTTAIYVYFHLYLVQLFEALGEAEPTQYGIPLSKAVYPWMVTDALIRWRSRLRGDDGEDKSAAPRALGGLSTLVSFMVVWPFGWVVIGYFWWRSFPAHDVRTTLLLGAMLILALWVSLSSLVAARENLKAQTLSDQFRRWTRWPVLCFWVLLILPVSWARTESYPGFEYTLARAKLIGEIISERPSDWRNRKFAKKWFREKWCKRGGLMSPCTVLSVPLNKEFEDEWWEERKTFLENLPGPILDNRDLRRADLLEAFMAGISLRDAKLNLANLVSAQFEGAVLANSDLSGANLSSAAFENADLFGANLTDADLFRANMTGANFHDADLEMANLLQTEMVGAGLRKAGLNGAELNETNFNGADFRGNDLSGAIIKFAIFDGALIGGKINNILDVAADGVSPIPCVEYIEELISIADTSFENSSFEMTAFYCVNISGTKIKQQQLNTAFGDKSVRRPANTSLPCHWYKGNRASRLHWIFSTPKPNDPFIGRWRGWVEANGGVWPTSQRFSKFKDVVAVSPPENCDLIKDM